MLHYRYSGRVQGALRQTPTRFLVSAFKTLCEIRVDVQCRCVTPGQKYIPRMLVQYGDGYADFNFIADLKDCTFSVLAKSIVISAYYEEDWLGGGAAPAPPVVIVQGMCAKGGAARQNRLSHTSLVRQYGTIPAGWLPVPDRAAFVEVLQGRATVGPYSRAAPLGAFLQFLDVQAEMTMAGTVEIADCFRQPQPVPSTLPRVTNDANNTLLWNHSCDDATDTNYFRVRYLLDV